MGTIIFDGKDLADFGVVPTGSGTFGAPARKYNATEIQGRMVTSFRIWDISLTIT